MGARRVKKGTKGEVTKYITRNKAVRKLQLSLHDFRRLCILKGIYPREPRHRKKVQKGNMEYKAQYYLKDIQFLSHEPLIWKFRSQKAHAKKIKSAVGLQDRQRLNMLMRNKPTYKIDHLVRERYPTFIDALRDLDDPLTLCFLFAKLPRNVHLGAMSIHYCRRLTIEFMHYVMAARALRKVFISIKGYYYQAELLGQTVTWIVPHPFRPENTTHVDFNVMKLFTEFYICLLGFINFRLYHSLNVYYPPRFTEGEEVKEDEDDEENLEHWKKKKTQTDEEMEHILISERIACLNINLLKSKDEDDEEGESFDLHLLENSVANVEKALEEQEKLKKFKNLFKNCKFFLNRETNMESLTFVIRSFGGQVSWDETVAEGHTYKESDETITHQIVDRPNVERKYLSRYYVQPQWVYDCVNAQMFLPVQEYFPGVPLPPHLSPFKTTSNDFYKYIPPEEERLEAMKTGEIHVQPFSQENEGEEMEESDDENDAVSGSEEDEDEEEGQNNMDEESNITALAERIAALEKELEHGEGLESKKKKKLLAKKKRELEKRKQTMEKMEVKPGSQPVVNKNQAWEDEREQYKLSVSMVPRKKKKIYRRLKRNENKAYIKSAILKERRQAIDTHKANMKLISKEKKAKKELASIDKKIKSQD